MFSHPVFQWQVDHARTRSGAQGHIGVSAPEKNGSALLLLAFS